MLILEDLLSKESKICFIKKQMSKNMKITQVLRFQFEIQELSFKTKL